VSHFAISLQQLIDIERQARELLKCHFNAANTRTIVDMIICPPTESTRRCYARFLNEGHLLPAQVFVSHCWDGSFGNLVAAVSSVFNPQGPVNSLFSFEKHPASNPHLWLSATSLWQGGDHRSAVRPGLHPAEGPFAEVMARVQTIVVALDNEINYFNRVWCVWELFVAEMHGIRRKRNGLYVVGSDRPANKDIIDLMKCEADEPADKQWILMAMQKDGLSNDAVAHPASEIKRIYCL